MKGSWRQKVLQGHIIVPFSISTLLFLFCVLFLPISVQFTIFFPFPPLQFSFSYCQKLDNLYRFSGPLKGSMAGLGIILPPSRAICFPRNVKINYSAWIILCNPAMSLNNLIRGGARWGFGACIIMSVWKSLLSQSMPPHTNLSAADKTPPALTFPRDGLRKTNIYMEDLLAL